MGNEVVTTPPIRIVDEEDVGHDGDAESGALLDVVMKTTFSAGLWAFSVGILSQPRRV